MGCKGFGFRRGTLVSSTVSAARSKQGKSDIINKFAK